MKPESNVIRIDRFDVIGHGAPRPDADRVLFCDGAGGSLFRDGADLELSHWRPNQTPHEYRAGTSTEICFRFVEAPQPGSWTIAVNNHVDVDGILSVYALVHSDQALAHRQTVIEAAEMGDFWGWGSPPAQRVFQGLTGLMAQGGEAKAIYTEAFRQIPALIDGGEPHTREIEESLAHLQRSVELVEREQIQRRLINPHFVQYIVPLRVAGDDDSRASYVPEFNEAISHKAVLWPHVRNRWDARRVCLVSTERKTGWFHDLCFPGYLWADTEGRWNVPGMTYHDGMSSYDIENAELTAAWQELQRQESAPGQWGLGGTSLAFGQDLQKLFPVVGRFLNEDGQPAVSHTSPDQMVMVLEGAFD
jgi:hypothetical protein